MEAARRKLLYGQEILFNVKRVDVIFCGIQGVQLGDLIQVNGNFENPEVLI